MDTVTLIAPVVFVVTASVGSELSPHAAAKIALPRAVARHSTRHGAEIGVGRLIAASTLA
jgi:hypothetical protein